MIYGPLPNGNYERRTLIYDKDVGRAAVPAVSYPSAAGQVFKVTDGGFHTLNEIIESICAALGCKTPRLSFPVGPMRIVAGLIEKGAITQSAETEVTKADPPLGNN